MEHTKKVTIIIVCTILVTIISLGLSIGAFDFSNANKGIAYEQIYKLDLQISELSDIIGSEDTLVSVISNPKVNIDKISYGVILKSTDVFTQFQFALENDGNLKARVKEINITGYEKYKDYVEIKVDGLNINDVIDVESRLSNIKVITMYKKPLIDENNKIKDIDLSNINIEFVFEGIE